MAETSEPDGSFSSGAHAPANSSERNLILVLGRSGALSGGDVHALRLAEGWSRAGTSPIVLVGDPELETFVSGAPGLQIATISTPVDTKMASSSLALAFGLAWRACRAVPKCRGGARVVAGSHLIFDVLPAAIARLLFRCEVFAFVYHIIGDMDRPGSLRTVVSRWLEGTSLWLLRLVRATVLVDNDEVRMGLVSRGFRPERVHDTGNAYDPACALPERLESDPPRLTFVGRLVQQKGVDDVLEIARRLHHSGSEWRVEIVGDGPERQRIQQALARDGLTNVRLHGFVTEQAKWEILARTTVFLAPSREEGWGIAVGEALLMGVPVIALDLPAYRHFPVMFERVPSGGAEFVDRILALIDDPEWLRVATRRTADSVPRLPRWSDVIARDIAVLMNTQRTDDVGA